MIRTNSLATSLVTLFILFFLASCSNESDAPAEAESMAAGPSIVEVSSAMGLDNVDSLMLTGTAWRIRNSFRQTLSASPPWPERDEISNYVQSINLDTQSMLATGETFASNLFLQPPVAGSHTLFVPKNADNWNLQMEFWLTPWGFIKGARLYDAQSEGVEIDGQPFTRFSWSSPQETSSPSGIPYTLNGYVNADGLVTRTETWVEDAFMGDMHVVGMFSDYQSFNGLMVPTIMEQQRGGGGVFGVEVAMASANPGNLDALLAGPQSNAGPGGPPAGNQPPADLTRAIGEGAWLVTGGYQAVVVEFSDHLAVFEAGQSESRGEQIIQQIRNNISDKEVRYIINSHPHSDHTAGLLPFIREGAVLVTHVNNVDFLRMVLSTPRTLSGEETLRPEIMGISGTAVLEDESNRIELHSVPNLHTDGMLVALLPAQGVLFQADFTLPQPGAEANPFVKTLARYISDNDVQFDQYIAVHAAQAAQNRDDLLVTITGEP